MQKQTFVTALQLAAARLKISEWVMLLARHFESANQGISQEEKATFAALVFDTSRGLSALRELGGPAMEVVIGYDLHEYLADAALAELVTHFTNSDMSARLRGHVEMTRLYYGLREFEKTVGASIALLQPPAVAEEAPLTLAIEVPSEGDLPVEVLSAVVDAVTGLHGVLARYVFRVDDHVAVSYLDSGSPMIIGFHFKGEIIKALRDSIFEAVDFIRFWKQRGVKQNVEAALTQLTLLRELGEAEAAGDVDTETASRVRHVVTRDLTTLFRVRALPKDAPLENLEDERVLVADAVPPLQLAPPADEED